MYFRSLHRMVGKSRRLLEKSYWFFAKSRRDFSINRHRMEMNKYAFPRMWPDTMKTRKYLDIHGGLLRESAPPSGASSASSATYFGVSFEGQTAAYLLTFIEIYVALQPMKLTFIEIYVALQPLILTFAKIYTASLSSLLYHHFHRFLAPLNNANAFKWSYVLQAANAIVTLILGGVRQRAVNALFLLPYC